jgi:zinc D-Ala-D-Ala carboxypeptidase
MERRDQFKCQCGCGRNEIDPRVVTMHQAIEEECMVEIRINSGFRCAEHNKAVGGEPKSSHLKGLAMDIKCETSSLRYDLIRAALHRGIYRIGIGKDFVHIDIDRSKDPRVVWLY